MAGKKAIDFETLKSTKVTVPVIALIGIAIVGFRINGWTVDYLSDFFVTKAVAEEQFQALTEAVEDNATLISSHIQTYELNENAKQITRTEDRIYELELFISANGESELTQGRMRSLRAELAKLGRVRACIIRNDKSEDCGAIQ